MLPWIHAEDPIDDHCTLVDWVIADMLAIQQGSLGHIRYVLKSDLRWIPLYGFYFEQVREDP